MSPSLSQESRQELEILREQIEAIQRRLRAVILQEEPLSMEATIAYNDVMFDLQSAREELKKLMGKQGELRGKRGDRVHRWRE